MKHFILFILLICGVSAFGQVRPDNFATDTTFTGNEHIYTQDGGSPRKILFERVRRDYFGLQDSAYLNYTPSASANTRGFNSIFSAPDGNIWFVAADSSGFNLSDSIAVASSSTAFEVALDEGSTPVDSKDTIEFMAGANIEHSVNNTATRTQITTSLVVNSIDSTVIKNGSISYNDLSSETQNLINAADPYSIQVDSVVNILGGTFELDKFIYCIENDARYLISTDTFAGVTVDSLTAIPVSGGNYAILAPHDGYLTPQNFKGYPNDLNADDVALNALFRFLENLDLPDNDAGQQIPVTTPMNARITGGNFILTDTVFLPQDYNVASDKDYPILTIDGHGGTLYCQTDSIVMLFHGGKNGSDFTTLDRGDYSAYIEGLTFKGGGPDSTRKSITGVFLGAMDYFVIRNIKMNNLGTNIFIANSYGGTISNVEIQGNLHRGIYVRSGTLWDNISNPCTAGNTELTVEKVRVVNTYSATLGKVYSQFEFIQCSGLTVKNCIAEGVRPFYNMIISYNGNACTNPANISTFYIENATHPTYTSDTDTCTNIWIPTLAYETYMDNVYFNFSKPDTLIRCDAQADGFLKMSRVNLPYSASFSTPGFILTDNTKWKTVVMETERTQTIADLRDFCVAAFSNFDNSSIVTIKTPNGIFSSANTEISNIGYANNNLGSSTTLTLGGNLIFNTLTNKNYIGIRGGASGLSYTGRPDGIGVGDEGLFLNWSAKIGWDQTETVNLNTGPYPTPGFYFAFDSTGLASNANTQNLIINPRNNNGEFRLYKNGYLKLEGYGSSFDMTAGALGTTIQHYAGWDTDGGLIHIPTIPSTDITSIGDSSTVALEISGFDDRIDSLEANSITTGVSLGLGSAIFKNISNDTMNFRSLVPNGGVTISQTDTTIKIDATTLYGVKQSFSPTTTVTWDLSNKIGGAAHIDCTSVSSGVTLTVSNPNGSFASYYTLYFYNVSGTDAITFPTGWIGEDGTALGTVNLTTDKYYACEYINIDASNLYLCK